MMSSSYDFKEYHDRIVFLGKDGVYRALTFEMAVKVAAHIPVALEAGPSA
jgi:hypothetical protein